MNYSSSIVSGARRAVVDIARILKKDLAFVVALLCATSYVILLLSGTTEGTPLTPDTMEYAEVARSLVRGDGFNIRLTEFHAGILPALRHTPEMHGLLQPFLYGLFFWLFGVSSTLVRVPNVLLVAVLAQTAFVVTRRYHGSLAGFIAAGLILVYPSFALWSLLGTDDIPFSAFTYMAFAAAERSLAGSEGRFSKAGIAAGLATLSKFTGVVVAFAVLVTVAWTARSRLTRRNVVELFTPTLAALIIYALRNYSVHGGFGFRFSAIDWLSKQRMVDYFAFYPAAPRVLAVWKTLGLHKIAALVWDGAFALASAIGNDPLLLVGSLVSVLGATRRHSFFCTKFSVVYSAAIAVVVVVAYHVEPRYLSGLVPLYATVLGSAISNLVDRAKCAGLPQLRYGGIAVFSALFVLGFRRNVQGAKDIGYIGARGAVCDDIVAPAMERVGPNSAVLTVDPWWVSWKMDRPAVMIPTNGIQAVLTVTRSYSLHWLLIQPPLLWHADSSTVLRSLAASPISAELAVHGASCDLYRLSDGNADADE